jgi:hypothetical protein
MHMKDLDHIPLITFFTTAFAQLLTVIYLFIQLFLNVYTNVCICLHE